MSDKAGNMTPFLFWLCGTVLVLALLFGGGTHRGFYGDVVVELLSVPLLMFALWPAFGQESDQRTRGRLALALCSTCAIVVLIQVSPLPFDVWGGRTVLLADGDGTRFGDYHPGWSTLSITPHATWAAAVSLLVPLSVFASVMQLGWRDRMRLCWLLLGVGAISMAVGFLQVAQGPDSALRFYEDTTIDAAVGFFANRNHFAAFLNVLLILAALWLMQSIEAVFDKRSLNTSSIVLFAAAVSLLAAIVVMHALLRSRAGAILAMAALASLAPLSLLHAPFRGGLSPQQGKIGARRVPLAVVLFAAIFALQFGLGHIVERFETDLAEDLRFPLNVATFETALKALPFGTGLGSFVPVYAAVEKSQNAVPGFANRAHDDLAELLLETGIIGALLFATFLIWLGKRALDIWKARDSKTGAPQLLMERASSLILVLLLLHSLVDYPLRTSALAAVFAFFCAILAAPVGADHLDAPTPRRRSRQPKIEPPSAPVSCGDEISWPAEWQRKE